MKIKNYWLHLKTINQHRKWVRRYCFSVRLYWQGLFHDISKYSPTEFLEGVKYFQGTRSPIKAAKEAEGYSMAWFHHRGRNKHHHTYWTDKYDEGIIPIKMPRKYVYEMICDWMGAARVYMGESFTYKAEYEWYRNRKLILHFETKRLVDTIMDYIYTYKQDAFDRELWDDLADSINY